MKILVVEDEKELCLSIAEGLRLSGYMVDTCFDGKEADQKAFEENYDLIILDINLPYMDGLTVLKNIRSENRVVNIILLTARDMIEDKVQGLDLGANDYITKPFHFEELHARIRSLLRRKMIQDDAVIWCGRLKFDTRARAVFVDEESVSLTNKEMGLLEYLLINRGKVINGQELLEHVWDSSVDPFSNSVRMHISSLRKKLKAKLNYDMVENVIGKGYLIKEEVQHEK